MAAVVVFMAVGFLGLSGLVRWLQCRQGTAAWRGACDDLHTHEDERVLAPTNGMALA